MSDRLLNASEVAEILNVEISWVRSKSRSGEIPTVHLGRWRRYRLEAIRQYMEDQERGDGFGR